MQLVPILFPCDIGYSEAGQYVEGGERGAPDLLLDLLESEGLRTARPIAVPVPAPTEGDAHDARIKFDALVASSVRALADAVESVNAEGDFPLILGGDHVALMGHALGHSRRHPKGIGAAILTDAALDLDLPDGSPGNAGAMSLAGCLRLISPEFALGRTMASSVVEAAHVTVAGVRGPESAGVRRSENQLGVDVWRMERIELDGESAYRSTLERHLAMGPILLSIDLTGLDPDLMTAVRSPRQDGLDWRFLKRSLDQCLPHLDRLLGLDISGLDPTRDDANQRSLTRFAETLSPFLRRLTR
jgi:arginase